MILNIETATTNCSVSIADQGQLIALRELNSKDYSHAEHLHIFIEEVLNIAGIDKNELSAIAVSKGPGSYTGLRIGVSAAKGLCFALDLPLVSVSTLEALALQQPVTDSELLVSLLDARRDEVYVSVYNHHLQVKSPVEAKVIEGDSFNHLKNYNRVYFIGPGAEKCERIAPIENGIYVKDAVPSAKEMAQLSWNKFNKGLFEDTAYFEPFYLKDFVVTPSKKKDTLRF
jgi:tRNA threonylcarbamoyladenosine biosynthesis protein TsaB